MHNEQELDNYRDFEDVKIKGIDQQMANEVWTKLKVITTTYVESVDHILKHSRHVFDCINNFLSEEIDEEHYYISIYPPNTDPDECVDDSKVDIILVKEQDGTFNVTQKDVDTGLTTSITTQEVNLLLGQIAASTRENERKVVVESVDSIIHKIKGKLQ